MSAEVHSYAAAVAEVGSVGEEEAGFFNHLNGILDWEVLAVDPGEVGGFDLRDSCAGDFFANGGGEEATVGAEVGEEVLTPGLAVFVGGFGGVVGDAVDLGKSVSACGGEATTDGVVRNDREGVAESGNVVGFTGGEESDGTVAEGLGEIEGREVRGLFLVEDEVAVDFVGEKNKFVFLAEGGELNDFLFCEDAAHRILGIAEDEDLGLRGDFGFECFPVEGPVAIDFGMIDGLQLHRGIVVNAEEGRVDGSAGEDCVAGFAKGTRGK